jgi:hypothetical protein
MNYSDKNLSRPRFRKMPGLYTGPGVCLRCVRQLNIVIEGAGTRQLNSDNYGQRTRPMNSPL